MEMESTAPSIVLETFAKHWPLLQKCLEAEILDPIDLILAGHILQNPSSENLEEACALCHLSLAVRAGHLCVKGESGVLEPSSEIFWKEFSQEMTPFIVRGLKKLSQDVVNPYVKTFENALYFQRYLEFESECAALFQAHMERFPTVILNAKLFEKYLSDHSALLAEQKEAIRHVLNQTLAFITGGPGTGKTYTACCLIEVLWNSLPPEKRESFEIALAAPTGKAASHLTQNIENRIPLDNMRVTSSTIHSLLSINPSTKEFKKKLPHDLILVDESSMIDIKLMTALLSALKPGARLVLLGDHRQLPPVEPGAPFNEMIQSCLQSNLPIKPGFLKVCMRAELKEIVHFADEINRGDLEAVFKSLEVPNSPVKGKSLPEATFFGKAVEELAAFFPPLNCMEEYPDIKVLKSFRLLSPLRKGLWGVESMNQALHKALMARLPPEGSPAIPILLSANDHQLQLFNGDMGFLWKDQGYFPSLNGTWRIIPASILPKYQYGYCLSVHKSQGSEFDRVVVLIPPGTEALGRSSLYTAATRAKQSLEVWYDKEAMEAALRQDKLRFSNLSLRISS